MLDKTPLEMALERERQERRDQSREISDYQAVRRKSRKWMQEMTRRKGLRER